jgi:DNA primase large subunit
LAARLLASWRQPGGSGPPGSAAAPPPPPAVSEADRLAPVVASLAGRYLGADYGADGPGGAPGGPITAADIPALAAASFPLCMQAMVAGLAADHHLKHKGRLQLGLFLKGAGLPLEEALRFWRAHFGPKCGGEDFDKRYAYGIRFNYGREGRRADYTPYSCVKIITTPVDGGECAGCPYKTLGAGALGAALARARVPPAAAADAASKAAAGHFQLACAAAWEGAHPGHELESAGVSHPNQYYDESRRARAADAEAKEAGEKGVGVVGVGGAGEKVEK